MKRAWSLLAGLLLSTGAWAATYTVDDDGDAPDVNPNDGLCLTAAGKCTLRAAIQQVNLEPAGGFLSNILFNINGGGPVVIWIASGQPLPPITRPVMIVGNSQPGSSVNTLEAGSNAVVNVRIKGQGAGSGLVFQPGSSGSLVAGMAITNFFHHGIHIDGGGGGLDHIWVLGNLIGTDGSGGLADQNGLNANLRSGVWVDGGATDVFIGEAPDPSNPALVKAARNVIVAGEAGAVNDGASLLPAGMGVHIEGMATRRVTVRNNTIGTTQGGTVPNGTLLGIDIRDSSNHVAVGNVIGARQAGVRVRGASFSNWVQGNRIGVGADDAAPIGGSGHGVLITDGGTGQSPQNTIVGGLAPDQGNHIARWGGNGVMVERFKADVLVASNYNSILGNSIHDNGQLGIELLDTATGIGTGPNTANPTPVLVNDSQVFPVIGSVTTGVHGTELKYGYAGTDGSTLEVFANPSCSPSNYGEGKTLVARLTSAAYPLGPHIANLPAVPAGQWLTMTATAPNGNTSEFSPCVRVVAAPGQPGGKPAGGGGATPVPTLGPAGLSMLSALLAGMGAVRRRQRRQQP